MGGRSRQQLREGNNKLSVHRAGKQPQTRSGGTEAPANVTLVHLSCMQILEGTSIMRAPQAGGLAGHARSSTLRHGSNCNCAKARAAGSCATCKQTRVHTCVYAPMHAHKYHVQRQGMRVTHLPVGGRPWHTMPIVMEQNPLSLGVPPTNACKACTASLLAACCLHKHWEVWV